MLVTRGNNSYENKNVILKSNCECAKCLFKYLFLFLQGRSVYFPKMTNKPGFIDISAISEFCNKMGDKLSKPTQKASVVGLGNEFPCFTKQDLHNILQGTKEEVNKYLFHVNIFY